MVYCITSKNTGQAMKPYPADLWQRVVELLTQQSYSLAVAESCTGGGIGKAVTEISGSSRVFLGGVIAYANEAKTNLLGVPNKTLVLHGAVSFETAHAMLEGVQRLFSSSCAIATTGIAGPTGGSPEKPVGTVFIAIKTPQKELLYHCLWEGNRHTIREQSIAFAGIQLARLLGETGFEETFPEIVEQRIFLTDGGNRA